MSEREMKERKKERKKDRMRNRRVDQALICVGDDKLCSNLIRPFNQN